jgi:hypothetical protein
MLEKPETQLLKKVNNKPKEIISTASSILLFLLSQLKRARN